MRSGSVNFLENKSVSSFLSLRNFSSFYFLEIVRALTRPMVGAGSPSLDRQLGSRDDEISHTDNNHFLTTHF